MLLATIYALEGSDGEVNHARSHLARQLTEPVAEMVARVINSLTGTEDLTKGEVLVNPAILNHATWNAPPLWLYVRPGRIPLLEEKVHELRNMLSEEFRKLLLRQMTGWAVRQGKVDRFDVEVIFLDGCGHTMGLDGLLLASWGDRCEGDRTIRLLNPTQAIFDL